MVEMIMEYERLIDRLFKADEWLKSKGIESWDLIKGKKAYIEYHKIIKEIEQLQKDLHKHLEIRNY